ncbi:ABC transporter substrate-binding protein [Bdellovibrio sp. NC01]|uniref:substrate-binding periplasmic protein n=1 Tax=Bdellovibrio sp. NC01 TaxID=2220073 RepID=UPI00143DD5CC|nr:transporter substrate-binding domain-containing protein [Bdellovibrio sp. NC01]
MGALNNEPIYFHDDKGVVRGVLIELIDELKRRTGCNFDPSESTRPMLVASLRSSAIDLTLISIKTPVMDQVASFIPMYLGTRAIVLAPQYAKKKTTLAEALKDKKIIFGSFIGATGYYKANEIEQLRKEQRLVEFYDYSSMFAALKKGKIQAMISSYVVGSYFMVQMKLTDFSFTQDKSDFTPVGSYYNPKRLRGDEVQMFSKVFDDIVKDGTMARIYMHYVPKKYVEQSFVPQDFTNAH